MIPRYQRILFAVLLVGSIVLAALLVNHSRNNYTLRDAANAGDLPMEGPSYAAAEATTLDLADDAKGTVVPTERSLALPSEPAVRTRALLEHLMAEYTLPGSGHPLGGGSAVEDVYLVPLPLTAPAVKNADGTMAPISLASVTEAVASADALTHETGELAVINLRSSWCDAHPSGITVETLTIDSMLGTLHANLPEITQVRFLVDGQSRSTLAGNVELDRTYTVADAANAAAKSE